MKNLLTTTAEKNFEAISTELSQLEQIDIRSERDIVREYLSKVRNSDNKELLRNLDSQIAALPDWKTMPDLVVTIPVVGTGDQETISIQRFFEEVSQDQSVRDKEVRFIFLVNRPIGSPADSTADFIANNAVNTGIEIDLLEVEITNGIGRLNEEIPEMAESDEQPVIGVIRNLLDYSAMQLVLRCAGDKLPVMLQMDIDFEGFYKGSFGGIIEIFNSYPEMLFLQCASDWDSKSKPIDSDPLLKLGSDLMRMLPLIVKGELNKPNADFKDEIIFGEVIQRGIQVPQAQRMVAVALKNSYGMLRFTADELDYNIRSSAAAFGVDAIRSTANNIFKWSNRRALRAWNEYGRPPISQWSAETPFSVNDPVRENSSDQTKFERTEIDVINLTLKRMPIPVEWSDNYKRKFEIVISQMVNRDIRLETSDTDSGGRVSFFVSLES